MIKFRKQILMISLGHAKERISRERKFLSLPILKIKEHRIKCYESMFNLENNFTALSQIGGSRTLTSISLSSDSSSVVTASLAGEIQVWKAIDSSKEFTFNGRQWF